MYRRRLVNVTARKGSSAALLAAVGCALAVMGCSRSSGTSPPVPPGSGSTYTLMQMNLCLSGLAGCYGKAAYPAVVEEAVARIREARPDAVTVNEACRRDVAEIARRGGYHLRFSRVVYLGKPLKCVQPGGRGLFGDAVLTRAAVASAEQPGVRGTSRHRAAPMAVRHHPSRRRRVHRPPEHTLEHRSGRERRAVRRARGAPGTSRGRPHRRLRGRRQPPPLLRARRSLDPHGPVRRAGSGNPARLRNGALRAPSAEVFPAAHTDHDVLLVRADLSAER